MADIQLYKNEKFGDVRATVIDGEPWFVAADVCNVLDLSNPTIAVSRLDEDERAKFNLGRQGDATIVNEPGLYTLVLGSRKPEAKAFKRWITHDVIPSIRKTGSYTMLPQDYISALKALVASEEERLALQEKNREMLPKAEYYDAVRDTKSVMQVKELSAYLSSNGVKIGRNRLFSLLRNDGYICRAGPTKNLPTQDSLDMGLMEVKQSKYLHNGEVEIRSTTYVTQRGLEYFLRGYGAM
nr:MAG TPA: repressor domain protein [Caudoviricetes sp.]